MQLIMSHVGTDFDGLASMILAQKLYPNSHLVFPGRKGDGVKQFYDLHKRKFPSLSNKEALAQKPQRMILVDTRIPSRLGEFRNWCHDPAIELHIYDHHPPTSESVKGDLEMVESVGAAATLLVERCRDRSLALSLEEASLALIAIHEETGSFRYSSTTGRDLTAAAFLMENGANLEVVSQFLQDPLTRAQRELLEDFLQNGEVTKGEAGRLYVTSARREKSIFGLGSLASRILEIDGSDAVCVILETESEGTIVAGRAGSDAFDLALWMSHWGGGGHKRAASASKINESADSVASQLKRMVASEESQTLKARDIMSTELFSIDLSYSVERASKELVEQGFHAACALDEEGNLQGLVSRTDLNKALDHNLGHAPARSVMTHKVVNVDADDTLEEVRRVVVERNVGSLPVMENGQLVGIVTRTDLLRELYQQETDKNVWGEERVGGGVDLSGVREPFFTWLKVSAEVAQEHNTKLYAVGGFVRDLLLRRDNDDLDLVVEGDASEFCILLQKRLSGKLITHEKYLTACLKFDDDLKLDVATARREVYVRPAALPDVAKSHLKSDLFRRDFTINALALRLDTDQSGTVIDFFGGRQDLETKKIRVLHNHSFLDDPTRILRAVRFEQRLGFKIEPHTEQLIHSAVAADIFEVAHAERLAEEFRLILSEHDPMKVLRRLQKLKLFSALHPELRFNKKTEVRLGRSLRFLERYPDFVSKERKWVVPLMLLGVELSPEARHQIIERFGWKFSPWAKSVHEILATISRRSLRPSEIAEMFESLVPEQIAVLAGVSTHALFEKRLTHYLAHTRKMTPILSGEHILEMGVHRGPGIAAIKRAAFRAQRDGEFSDVESARSWLSSYLLAGKDL